MGANQQPTTLWSLKEMAMLYDPGQAPPPVRASLLGDLEMMENGSTMRMSTTRPSMGLSPQGPLLCFFSRPPSLLLPPLLSLVLVM